MPLRWPQPLFAVPSLPCRRHCYWSFARWCPERILSIPHIEVAIGNSRDRLLLNNCLQSCKSPVAGNEGAGSVKFFFMNSGLKKKNPQSHYFKTSTSFITDSLTAPPHLFLSHILIKVTISSFPHTYTIKIIQLWNLTGKRNWRGTVIWQSVFLFHPLHMYTHCPLSSPQSPEWRGWQTLVWFLLELIPYWKSWGRMRSSAVSVSGRSR